MKKFLPVIVLLFVLASLLVPASQADAFSLMDGVGRACKSSGDCTVCDIIRVVYNVGRFIFLSMSGVALIFLTFAAIRLIFNWGHAESIASAKRMIFHTLIAIGIILIAWTLVNATIYALRGELPGTDLSEPWSAKNWWQGPTCSN